MALTLHGEDLFLTQVTVLGAAVKAQGVHALQCQACMATGDEEHSDTPLLLISTQPRLGGLFDQPNSKAGCEVDSVGKMSVCTIPSHIYEVGEMMI